MFILLGLTIIMLPFILAYITDLINICKKHKEDKKNMWVDSTISKCFQTKEQEYD